MHLNYISIMFTLLSKLGINEADLLNNTGLTTVETRSDFSFTTTQLNTLCSNALHLSKDFQLGLKVGSQFDLPSQGIFGYALMTSSTVGDALRLLVRYNRIILPSIQISLKRSDGRMEVQSQAEHLPPELDRFYCQLLYAAILNSRHILFDNPTTSFRLELDYAAPEDTTLYEKIFGPKTRFNSERRALSFDIESLEIPISTANTRAQDLLQRECDRLLPRDSHRGHVSARVLHELLQARSEFPTCAAMAKIMHMSESTLQRHLAKEGTKFQQLLDKVRYRLASEYLLGTSLPVSEIAFLLGFSDTTNFRRSFRRWSNVTPSQVRERG
ncbi:MAG: AraC-like DNA-binding protein [Pseudohongiellaceae bacterium]|jgi:AraC-like DNA-binding protein